MRNNSTPFYRNSLKYLNGKEAKKSGRNCKLRSDWESIKEDVMKAVIHAKFQNKELRTILLATGDAELIEGNTWNDIYCGVCNGGGKNRLGITLTIERSLIRLELKEKSNTSIQINNE